MAGAYRKTFEFDMPVYLHDTIMQNGALEIILQGDEITDMVLWNDNFVGVSGHSPELVMGFFPVPMDEELEYIPNTYANSVYMRSYVDFSTLLEPFEGRLYGSLNVLFLPIAQPVEEEEPEM